MKIKFAARKDKISSVEPVFESIQLDEIVKAKDALSHIEFREKLVQTSIRIISFSIIATFLIIFFVGFGLMEDLPDGFLHWLGGATIAIIISNILIVYKYFFQYKNTNETVE